MKVEKIKPYTGDTGKQVQMRQLFDTIARRYDRMNRIMSLGTDIRWRRRALRLLRGTAPQRLLDVATGTADMALMLAQHLPQAQVTGIDLSSQMLAVGRQKIVAAGLEQRIELIEGDALALPFADATFDVVTAAFGVRNFADISAGLREMRRVLKPQGNLVIVELSQPGGFPMRQLFQLYMRLAMPLAGCLLARHNREYRYLPASIQHVPQGSQMLELMRKAGFSECQRQSYTFGICSGYSAIRV